MASPRVDSTSLPVDPVLQAMLVDIDSLRSQVVAYVQTDQQRRNHTHQLETDLAKVQLQLLESRKENARLKQEALGQSSDAPRVPASQPLDSRTEPESQALRAQTDGLRRKLRNSQKDADDEDWVLPAQSSVMANSPSVGSTHFQSAHMEDAETSTPFVRTGATNPTQTTAGIRPTTTRTARASRAPVPRRQDIPEQMSPVQRTPRVTKTQSLGASLDQTAGNREDNLDEAGPSISAPPSQRNIRTRTQSGLRTNPLLSANQQPVADGREDPYETDYTYNGPEGEETLSAPPRPSSIARGKMPEIPEPPTHEAPPSSQTTEHIHVEFDAARSKIYCGPIAQDKMLKKLECSRDIIDELNALAGATSFHLTVHEDYIFVEDPIGLETGDILQFINWGTPKDNEAICRRIWGDDQQSPAAYHTFVRRVVPRSKKAEWSYIGIRRWSMSDIPARWPKYNSDAQHHLSTVLVRRWRSDLRLGDVAAMIECDELQQFCVELNNDEELEATSRFFAETVFPKTWRKSQATTTAPV